MHVNLRLRIGRLCIKLQSSLMIEIVVDISLDNYPYSGEQEFLIVHHEFSEVAMMNGSF